MNLTIIVPGEPVPKGRPRFSTAGGYVRTFTPAKTKSFEEIVKWNYLCTDHPKQPIDDNIHMQIDFYFPVPKSMKVSKFLNIEDTAMNKKPDIDNLVKSVLDALNKVAYRDDALISSIFTKKRYSKNPRTEITMHWEG